MMAFSLILSRDFYSKTPNFNMLEIFGMPHFSFLILKMGHSEYLERIESGTFQIKST